MQGLPGWLRTVVRLNPASHGIEATRGLVLGDPAPGTVFTALGVNALVGLAIRGFRRRD